ncbi:MAG: alpha-glucan family phosphorylase [Culturomica sp.]|jgi:phosphorylase/glycogen(starch) synthase|nr:alpha-glucan family phosphorylase [Culturomica sp.]
MDSKNSNNPAYLFEVSWEVCNKVGGIHTVIATKALNMSKEYNDSHILIGPDVWRYTEQNPEFIDEPSLFKSWRVKAAQEGLRIKIGRWNIAGKPIVILVDFTTFIHLKDKIFSDFWEKYKLDSISGQWDYIEPALFGYTAGKVIESFVRFNSSVRQRIIAQFHEWMTGTGILYLKSALPQVGCVFTTHATVLGRSVAGNNLPLYNQMKHYVPDELARRFNVVSKQSLEKASAHFADCFTTVSDITATECAHFLDKEVDLVTPNGFENVFTPKEYEFKDKQYAGREKFLQVAQSLLGRPVSENALIVGISGRYEFKNKGIDVFIEALSRLNKEKNDREVLAFILVPGGHNGPNLELLHNMQIPNQAENVENKYVTHYLSDENHDPVMQRIKSGGLNNSDKDKVKIFFVPSYLNGDDGIFNMPYYDLLIGMDLTVFPSYYEPWGYTPLESLAFKVPTITTTLAGFGLWVKEHYNDNHPSIEIIHREDFNNEEVINAITKRISYFAKMDGNMAEEAKNNAGDVSKIALWDNLIKYYKKAYEIAMNKVNERLKDIPAGTVEQVSYIEKQYTVNDPRWVSVMINRSIPNKLMALEELAKNLWWCWNDSARELFRYIDIDEWRRCGHNPIALLDKISLNRYKELENDDKFVKKLNIVYKEFKDYMAGKDKMSGDGVAYFSMEYGLHTSLKIYSGGLGILAGDYLKEASDKGTKMTAVGLLYRYGYFTQKLSAMGNQEAEYEAQDFMKIAVSPMKESDGKWLTVSLVFPGRNLYARVWRVDVGRVELYLLDTDIEENLQEDRSITHHLYGGDWENRLKQELLLGCGGIQALRKLGVEAATYHCNEGHAAFIGIERLKEYISEQNLTFNEALEVVRSSSLFTTHTPVPAGHDFFSEDMLRTYISHYADRLQISWERLLGLGKINISDPNERFSMSYLAANLSQEVNGVSMLHGKVSQEIFKGLWPGYFPEELHISYVTNGVHYPTWTAPEWKAIHAKVFGDEFQTHHYDKKCFEGIYEVSDDKILETRKYLRKRLIDHIKMNLTDTIANSYFTPHQVLEIDDTLKDDVLTIGFARRFATYKRAHLLFRNLDRLNEIVNNPKHPVQFIFAGKAHPADKAGQDLIKRIVDISKDPRFMGKVLFIPNYDMDLAKKLVQGVDVWLNTPTRPQEASGTSGEKAAMNGVMHFSVLDGWWVEGYRPDAGWMLPEKRTYENQNYQDELDSEMLYNTIDDEIAPLFYKKDSKGVQSKWVAYIKNTVAKVAANFTSNRMLIDYENQYYIPMSKRYAKMIADNYSMAIEIATWKKKISREWDNIQVVDMRLPKRSQTMIELGKSYNGSVVLEIGELSKDEVGVELVVAEQRNGRMYVRETIDFTPVSQEGSKATYSIEVTPDYQGILNLAIRLYPKSELLPHRQDFALVKWL